MLLRKQRRRIRVAEIRDTICSVFHTTVLVADRHVQPTIFMTQATHRPQEIDLVQSVPDGFEPVLRGSPFVQLIGPIFHKKTDDGRHIVGVRIEERHTNIKGIAHGGMLVTLADSALGIAIALENSDRTAMVTVNLSTDFVEAAYPGDWVEAHVDLQRIGGRLAFANCYLKVAEKRILRASGVFAAASSSKKPAE
jgi:uncharacterized protein (TIGR00369 family)